MTFPTCPSVSRPLSDPKAMPEPATTQEPWVIRAGSLIGDRWRNDDRLVVTGSLIAVADGVGGAPNGHAAAQLAVGRLLVETAGSLSEPDVLLRRAFQAAHAEVVTGQGRLGDVNMATTLTMLHLDSDPGPEGGVRATLGWVGNSPAYLIDGLGGFCELTSAHNDSFIGITPDPPRIAMRTLTSPTRFIIATDGIRVLSATDIEHLGRVGTTPECLENLLAAARQHTEHHLDNTTIAVIDITTHDTRPDRKSTP